MTWNDAPEYVSLIFISIILLYSREYNMIPTLKNKIFKVYLQTVFYSTIISVTCTLVIENHRVVPMFLVQAVNLLYFITMPLMAVVYLFYIISVLLEDSPKVKFILKIVSTPYILYILVVLTNPVTRLIYFFREVQGYTRGPGFMLVYVIIYLYITLMFVFTLLYHRKNDKFVKLILVVFPSVSIMAVILQKLFPHIVLSGTAATSALLIVYLYFQNKKIVIDDLTGFQNRKAFSKVLELNVNQKLKMNIILISLDDFKAVNYKYGQVNGDNFLKEMSQYLTTVVPIKCIYRYSGDEFAIILEDSNYVATDNVVRTLKNRFNDHWNSNILTCILSVSLAVIELPAHAETVEDIITLLEYCIAQSKENGKGRVIFSDAEMVNKVQRKNQIIEILKQGLINDSFVVYYQPIYSIKENKFTSAEALLRLFDKDLGVISPVEFIPIAEETGMIINIGYMVLDKVCKYIRILDDSGIEIDGISVNFSSLQMFQEGLVDNVMDIIYKNQVNPKKIRIEITESAFIDKFDYVKNVMDELGNHGIEFYLDDFGTGYSNLASVIQLKFEYIKLDKSILYNSINCDNCLRVMNALSKGFSEVGIKIIVEGVENQSQQELADNINADYIQGFSYAKPMAAVDAIVHLKMGKINLNLNL